MEPGDRGDYPKDWKPEPVVEEAPKKKVKGDLNDDGVFDKKDMAIAGKTLASGVRKIFDKKKKK
jgi:hypothetical protein